MLADPDTRCPGVPGRWSHDDIVHLPTRHPSTINQVRSAVGIAALGTLLFTRATTDLGAQGAPAPAFSDALGATFPWQIALYVIAAGLLALLPVSRSHTPPSEDSRYV